jgi:hypothetical protein
MLLSVCWQGPFSASQGRSALSHQAGWRAAFRACAIGGVVREQPRGAV